MEQACGFVARRSVIGLILVLLLMLACVPARAQCYGERWLPVDSAVAVHPAGGANTHVSDTTMWDPDGPGPRTPVVVIAGYFSKAGPNSVYSVATWDPVTGVWETLGTQYFTVLTCLTVLANGDLIVGGSITINIGGGYVSRGVARWDPAAGQWRNLGSGLVGTAYALAGMPNGDLIAGGSITNAGGNPVNYIARWDGSSWSAIGAGADSSVYSLKVTRDGNLFVGGAFQTIGGVAASRIAKWNGQTWSPLGSGVNNVVNAIDEEADGSLVVGGGFTTAGAISTRRIARWDGTSWSALGTGMDIGVSDLAVLSDGDIVAVGSFTTAGGVSVNRIARWNGSEWSGFGSGLNFSGNAIEAMSGGRFLIGGTFTTVDGMAVNYLAWWDGSQWRTLGAGPTGAINAMVMMPNGDLMAAGAFTALAGVRANRIARWNGSYWTPEAAGLNGTVYALARLANGDLIAAGAFTAAGDVAANRIARWDGSNWTPLGAGFNDAVRALAVLPNGDLVAGGSFTTADGVTVNRIARWNGTAWSGYGLGVGNGDVYALAVRPNGDLFAGGTFTSVDGVPANGIARWDGASWTVFDADSGTSVYAMLVLPNGDLVVGSNQYAWIEGPTISAITTFNGTSWTPPGIRLSVGTVKSLALAENGDLYVGSTGWDPDRTSADRVTRIRGDTWTPVSTGTDKAVNALVVLPHGELVAGGEFSSAEGFPAGFFARYRFWPGTPVPPGSATNVVFTGESLLECGVAESFTAEALGNMLSIQWQIETGAGSGFYANLSDGSTPSLAVVGARARVLNLACSDPAVSGRRLRYVASNGCTSYYSNAATLTVVTAPAVTREPSDQSTCVDEETQISVAVSGGALDMLWQIESDLAPGGWASLSEGLFEVGGVTIADVLVSRFGDVGTLEVTLREGVRTLPTPFDQPRIRAVISNACGQVVSGVATISVREAADRVCLGCATCVGDYDQDGGVTGADIGAFFVDFESGAACADVDLDGGVTGADIGAFFLAYEAGGC